MTAQLGLRHESQSFRQGERVRGPFHLQNVNNYHSRRKGWLCRLNGVSTRNLQHHVSWFRMLDAHPPLYLEKEETVTLMGADGDQPTEHLMIQRADDCDRIPHDGKTPGVFLLTVSQAVMPYGHPKTTKRNRPPIAGILA